MLDLAFPDSPLLGCHGASANGDCPRPGSRFPARTRLTGCLHHLLVYDQSTTWNRAQCAARWSDRLEIVAGEAICSPGLAGVSQRGAVLVRPDGYIGFQAEAWTADAHGAFEAYFARQFEPATTR
jgi:hypothetical protein